MCATCPAHLWSTRIQKAYYFNPTHLSIFLFLFFGAEYYSVNATHYRSPDTEPCCYDLRVSSRTLERNLYFELRMQARLFWNRTLQIAVRFSIVHVGDSKPMSTDSCISGHSPHLTIFSSSLIWDCKTRFSSRSLSFSPLARFIC